MPWIRLDDSFSDHPKVAEAGPLAAWLHVKAMIYCGRHLTDGKISRAVVVSLVDWESFGVMVETSRHDFGGSCDTPNNFDLAASLVAVGLWDEVGNGYAIHDYLKYQPSREQVLSEREANRRRVEKHRSKDGTFGNGITNGVCNGNVTTAPSRSHPVPVPNTEETHTAAAPLELVPRSPLEAFDLEAIYALYPRKGDGKAKGIERLKAQIRNRETYEQALLAARHYAEKAEAEKTPPEYIKRFDTWCNKHWRDYVDGPHIVAGKSQPHHGERRGILDPIPAQDESRDGEV